MTTLSEFRLLMPEEIELTEADYPQARAWVDPTQSEAQQWQAYLNGLGLLAFEQWLSRHSRLPTGQRQLQHLDQAAAIAVGDFRVCLLAQEDYLGEWVQFPQALIDHPALAAHFYGIVEVDEEGETVILRGISRRDRLVHCSKEGAYYRIPLDYFDAEWNHFLADCRYLSPAALPLPQAITPQRVSALRDATTKLSHWLDGVMEQGWQAIDQLLIPEAQLAFATRNLEAEIQAGKLLDLELSLGHQQAVLLVTLTPTEDEKLRVQVRLFPFNADYLPANVQLQLKSRSGKCLQSVESRQQDNYIQLKPFKGEPGKVFQLEVNSDGHTICETFEL